MEDSTAGGDTRDELISAPEVLPPVEEQRDEVSSLYNDYDYNNDAIMHSLWRGVLRDDDGDPFSQNIHIIIAYCSHELSWITNHENMAKYQYASITIISKCGNPVEGAPEGSTIVELPNAGRNDHSFVYYITNLLDTAMAESNSDIHNSIVFFIKDNAFKSSSWFQHIDDMAIMASSRIGFGCGTPGPFGYSAYADYDVISSFSSPGYVQRYEVEGAKNVGFKSEYDNLRHWHTSLGVIPTVELVQACFEGRFSASVSQIKKVEDRVWRKMEEELRRGDNIEEEHFAERTWGVLLSQPLPAIRVEALKDFSIKISNVGGKLGVLCKETRLEGCAL